MQGPFKKAVYFEMMGNETFEINLWIARPNEAVSLAGRGGVCLNKQIHVEVSALSGSQIYPRFHKSSEPSARTVHANIVCLI